MISSVREIPLALRNGGVVATAEDRATADCEIERERQWLKDYPEFATNGDILEAAYAGKLVPVRASDNFRPISRFLNPELDHIYPPYLLPFAASGLSGLTRLWRTEALALGVSASTRLSATSFVRSAEYQRQLINDGKLAVENSSHPKGAAFDLALADYYAISGNEVISISLRPPDENKAAAGAFASIGARHMRIKKLGPEHFDERVPQALLKAAEAFHRLGLINRVIEFPGTDSATLHVGFNPYLAFHTQ